MVASSLQSYSDSMMPSDSSLRSVNVPTGNDEVIFKKTELLPSKDNLKELPTIEVGMATRVTLEGAKRAAAFAAGERHIFNGCRLGVGSGSTARYLVEFLEDRIKAGKLKDIVCVPTSFLTRKWLLDAGLSVTNLEQQPELDVCIDGADEVDANLNLIKGGGGCLTQEKIVQTSAKHFFVIADSSKQSTVLGEKFLSIPIEVVPSAYVPVMKWIKQQEGGECVLRMAQRKCGPVITDNNNYLVDWNFPKGKFANTNDLAALHQRLVKLPGVVETGLFVGVAEKVYFATPEGAVIEKAKPH
uniref:ribose-5-phosphate isomerase n=1 Tax=Ascaris lumbricoides TaxID=6252 RepID=A0A0M3I540_ASCLU